MRNILATLFLTATSMTAFAQTTVYDVSKDPKNGELTFKGQLTIRDLEREASFSWFKSGVSEYKPDEKQINVLKEQLPKYTMVVFLGTWCDDSHYLVPKLEKVLQLTAYPQSQLTMYGVDREKTTKGGEEKKYNVTLVPTVILLDNSGKEIGRITESVQKTIEADLCAMLPH